MGNALEQLRRETKDDAKLYGCIKELYEQGVPFSDLKALIPDIRRTREQLYMKRMLENNNEVLLSMFSKEMSFLLDAKERQEEEQFKKLEQKKLPEDIDYEDVGSLRIEARQKLEAYRKAAAGTGPVEKLKKLFLPA